MISYKEKYQATSMIFIKYNEAKKLLWLINDRPELSHLRKRLLEAIRPFYVYNLVCEDCGDNYVCTRAATIEESPLNEYEKVCPACDESDDL